MSQAEAEAKVAIDGDDQNLDEVGFCNFSDFFIGIKLIVGG